MLRIEIEQKRASRAEAKLYGKVTAETVGALRDAVYELVGCVPHVFVDLAEVTMVDRAGLELLRGMSRDGVYLRRPSSFVREWLKAESRLAKLLACTFFLLLAPPPAVRAAELLTMESAVAAAVSTIARSPRSISRRRRRKSAWLPRRLDASLRSSSR